MFWVKCMQLHSSVTRPVNCTSEGYLKILNWETRIKYRCYILLVHPHIIYFHFWGYTDSSTKFTGPNRPRPPHWGSNETTGRRPWSSTRWSFLYTWYRRSSIKRRSLPASIRWHIHEGGIQVGIEFTFRFLQSVHAVVGFRMDRSKTESGI